MASFDMSTNISNGSLNQDNVNCSFNSSIPNSAAYSMLLLATASLIGNILLVLIVYRRQELRRTINYFIVNMAVSDVLISGIGVSFCIVVVVNNSWHWPINGSSGFISCKLKIFLEVVSVAVSSQSHVWIALDRFVAVVFPMKVHLISSRSRLFAITSTWILAIVIDYFYLSVYNVLKINDDISCLHFHENSSALMKTYLRVYTAIFQIAPITTMTILYSVIAFTLRRQEKVFSRAEVHHRNHRTQKARAVKMTFSIMAAFYICSFPFLLATLLWQYEIAVSCSFWEVLWSFAIMTIYLSSTINPVICITFIRSYRDGFKDIFKSCWRKCLRASNLKSGEHQVTVTLQSFRKTSS